jgi:hypothetical protein
MFRHASRGTTVVVPALVLALSAGALARAQEGSLEGMRSELRELRQENDEMRAQLDQVQRTLSRLQTGSGTVAAGPEDEALDRALEELPEAPRPTSSERRLRLVDISFIGNAAVGTSSATSDDLLLLQGGGHDPRNRGFTLQQGELSFLGAVDPYFTGEAHLIYFLDPEGESRFEIEELFLTTQTLPYGLQLEFGHFFTEFGRQNPQHPHFWHWLDQPILLSRLFGEDGMRGPGARLGWLLPLPWFSELHAGAQNAFGETMVSYLASEESFAEQFGEGTGLAGRTFVDRDVQRPDDLVYLLRWQNAFDLTESTSVAIGTGTLFGPNSTGDDGATRIYGADLVAKWRPGGPRGWPFVILESEIARRDYVADDDPTTGLRSQTLQDWGGYVQGLWGFLPRFAAGARFEYASGSGASNIAGGRASDPFRSDRTRISPLLAFYPSEFSRIRLQYNFDRADFLERRQSAHSFWLGFEISLGAHGAHSF